MPLTDPACKNASCPTNKPLAGFTDSEGLYLEVATNGSKRWFWKYQFAGKEKRLALGSYPGTRPKIVRTARDDARKLQRSGIDPVQQRQVGWTYGAHLSSGCPIPPAGHPTLPHPDGGVTMV